MIRIYNRDTFIRAFVDALEDSLRGYIRGNVPIPQTIYIAINMDMEHGLDVLEIDPPGQCPKCVEYLRDKGYSIESISVANDPVALFEETEKIAERYTREWM